MSLFLPHLHTDLRNTWRTRRSATAAKPDEVPRGLHKEYRRMERVAFSAPAELPMTLANALRARTSYSGGDATHGVTNEELGTLLGLALGKREGSSRRNHPSGGALYPIEAYVAREEEVGCMLYHYHPTDHALERLWTLQKHQTIKDLVPRPTDVVFGTALIFTSVWGRSTGKYGNFTYPLALLEAGHMSENVLLIATALGLASRPVASFDDAAVCRALDLDSEREQPLHSIVLSRVVE